MMTTYQKLEWEKFTEDRAGLWRIIRIGGLEPGWTPSRGYHDVELMEAEDAERYAKEFITSFCANGRGDDFEVCDDYGRILCEFENEREEIRLFSVRAQPYALMSELERRERQSEYDAENPSLSSDHFDRWEMDI